MILRRLYEEKLAQASYLVGCKATGDAVIIDPNRDIEQYMALAQTEGLRIVAVAETHIHADYLSGSLELAQRTGAKLLLSDEGGADWKYAFSGEPFVRLVRNGDSFLVGNLRFDVIATPGHTPEHIAFVLTDLPASSEPHSVFTGDFIFVGDVGRPDLLERAAGFEGTMDKGAEDLFNSLNLFLSQYSDDVLLWPAHGAGSACGKGLGGVPVSSLGYERRTNPGLKHASLETFSRYVLDGQPEPPSYFKEMKRLNRDGPDLVQDLRFPIRLDARQLGSLSSNAVLVDIREASQAQSGFVPGALIIPVSRSFTTWAGSLISYAVPIYLVANSEDQVAEAVYDLRMIGLDQVRGWFSSEDQALPQPGVVPRVTAAHTLEQVQQGLWQLLDVRGQSEYIQGHVSQAFHIPLGSLMGRLGELNKAEPIAIYCAGGSRSPIAASILVQNGFEEVYDLTGGFAAVKALGVAC